MPRLLQQLAYYYPHIIILAIQLQQRNLEPLRFDSTYLYVPTLVIQYSQTFQQGTLLHESHPRWHSCMCKKKVETAQDRGRSFAYLLPIATMGMSQKNIFRVRFVCKSYSCVLSLNTNLTFFRLYDARR